MVISGFAASTVWIGSDETQSQLLYIFCSVIKERLSEKKRKRGDDMQQRDPGRCSKDSVLIHMAHALQSELPVPGHSTISSS